METKAIQGELLQPIRRIITLYTMLLTMCLDMSTRLASPMLFFLQLLDNQFEGDLVKASHQTFNYCLRFILLVASLS